jgi:hypothetical protein
MLESQDRQKTATQDREIQPPTKRHWWLIDLAAVVFLLVVFSWSLTMIDYPISPLPSAGERWGTSSASDFTIMIAGRNFHKEGFANNYFLSNEAVGYPEFARNWLADELPETDRGPRIYETRYGSTDSIVNRLLRYFDVEDITSFYRVSALVSILALGLWYASASLLFGRAIGLISLVFMGTAPIFLSHIDTLTYIPYDYLLAFGALLLFLLAMRQSQDNRRKWPLLGGAWLLTALQGFTALEFLLWLQAFFIGYLWITRNSFPHRWQLIALMASASFSGLVLRFSFAAWALGGLGNAWDSVWLTLTSSSVGFGLAAEAPFGEFSWSAMLSNVERGLWSNTHIELVGLIVLLVLAAWLTRKLQSQLQPSQAARLRAQLRLLPAFLIGGIAYWVLFLHSGVSQHPLALRTVLPFAGLLVAYSANITWHFILMERQRYLQKGTALAAVIAVLLPATAGIVSGSNFDFPRYTQSPDYYGRTSNEVKIVSEFIHENTRYGDVVLTNLNIGNTGLRGYPFAGYEYLSERRLESARDLPQLIESLTELEATRQPLPLSNPASEVDFYVLMDAPTRSLPYGWLVYQIAESVSVLDTGAWWANHRGGIPPGEDQNQFFLYRIDQSAIEESSLREQADDIQRMGATAAWTKISNMRILPDGEIEPWDARGIFDIKSASNGILAMKTGDYNTGFLGRVEDGFDNDTGSTVEVKLKLLDASLHGFQGACIALQNGEREGKLSFYPDHIIIRDANTEKASFEMDTMDDFHIYRLAMIEDTLRVYVDGEEVAGVALKNEVNSKAVMFGDLSPEEGENIYAEIDYISYSIEGAFSPGEAGSLDSW